MWDISTGQPIMSLSGHTLTVCGLATSQLNGGQLVSVSWDKTARVWDLSSMSTTAVLSGHQAAVWAALILDDGTIATGSADRTIKLWQGTTCRSTLQGHTDCVRALARTEYGFASAGNDGMVRLWTALGDAVGQIAAHGAFIYSLAALPSGELVTSAEDRTARVWSGEDCVGTLQHAGSVWGVCALADGDVVTTCADGVARVWTRVAARAADPAVQAAYEQALASQTIAAQEVGGVQLDKLPGIEALETPGNKDGATKIVRVGTSAYAYAWNASESKWDQIGTVVDGPAGSGGKTSLNGVEYDKVFDVQVDENLTLKCGYNYGQNPYDVAQEFIWANDLPQDHLDEIATFIDRNANQGVTLGAAGPSPSFGGGGGGGGAAAPRPPPADPLTGSHNVMYEQAAGGAQAVHIPKKVMVFFEQVAKAEPLEKKAAEFNAALAASPATAELAMSEEEMGVFRGVVQGVCGADRLWRPPPASYGLLCGKLLRWPPAMAFPGLDVMRLFITNAYASKHFSSPAAAGDPLALAAAALAAPDAPAATRIMGLRLLSNAFRTPDTRPLVIQRCEGFMSAAKACLVPPTLANVQVQLGVASLVLNYGAAAVEAGTGKTAEALGGPGAGAAVVRTGSELAVALAASSDLEAATEADVPYRLLAGLGTIIQVDAGAAAAAHEVGLARTVAAIASRQRAGKGKDCAQQLLALL